MKFILASLLIGALCLSAKAQQLDYGNTTCGSWIVQRRAGASSPALLHAWVLGYLSGAAPPGRSTLLEKDEEAAVDRWIDNYCDSHQFAYSRRSNGGVSPRVTAISGEKTQIRTLTKVDLYPLLQFSYRPILKFCIKTKASALSPTGFRKHRWFPVRGCGRKIGKHSTDAPALRNIRGLNDANNLSETYRTSHKPP